jgi:hypothetical protein
MKNHKLHKYPRTQHIEGSRSQPGDEDLDSVPFSAIAGRHLVVEEKVDGANAAISFGMDGELLLQSRGHFLTGGAREKHFTLFKQWAQVHRDRFFQVLGHRHVLYGEWLYAKHTIFYDRLPHYFMEFDVLDVEAGQFLSTGRRQELLAGLPIVSVRVLASGKIKSLMQLGKFVGRSAFISDAQAEQLRASCLARGLDLDRVMRETDPSSTMEGIYIKVETGGVVTGRYKYIRPCFLTAVLQSEGHWLSRPILPNLLAPGVDIFESKGEAP